MKVTFTIDGQSVTVEQGTTVLDAARQLGIRIPTLCHVLGYEPENACLLCVVRVNGGKRLRPACSLVATEGMQIESETDQVHAARRTAVELLLSDHAGDCLAPCQNTCPAHMDIPLMMQQILADDLTSAIATVKADIPLPAVLGRICPAPCEGGCRRNPADGPVSVCLLKRYVADHDLQQPEPYLPELPKSTGHRVAIIGAGPTGLSAAYYLQLLGYQCTVLDEGDAPGGKLRTHVPSEVLPVDVLEGEIDVIRRLGVQFEMNQSVQSMADLEALLSEYDAVLLATGHVADPAMFGLQTTSRGVLVEGRTFQTSHPRVFAAGAILRQTRLAVRSVAEGKLAAMGIDRALQGSEREPVQAWARVAMGRLEEQELVDFMLDADASERLTPEGGLKRGYTRNEAMRESQRCMQCNCSSSTDCNIRKIATDLEADLSRYRGERRRYQPIQRAAGVTFEPGKCISCGLCVQAVRKANVERGITFIGRGFDVHLAVPFGRTLADGLGTAAMEAVRICPTGALQRDAGKFLTQLTIS